MGGFQKSIVCFNILLVLVQFIEPAKMEDEYNLDEGSGREGERSVSHDYYLDLNECHECNNPTDQADILVMEEYLCSLLQDDPPPCQRFYQKCLAICHKQETKYLEAVEDYFENMSFMKKNRLKIVMRAPFSDAEHELDMKQVIHKCAKEKLGLNHTTLPFSWNRRSPCKNNTDILETMLSANSPCRPVWNNLRVRMEFYQNCLKSYDIRNFKRKGVSASRTLQRLAYELHTAEKQKGNNQVGGGSAMIAGGIMAGIGVLLTPITGGASLALTASALTIAGTGISMSGTLATMFGSDPTKFVHEATMEIKDLKEDGNSIAALLLLYMVSHDELQTFIDDNRGGYRNLTLQIESDISSSSRNIFAGIQSANLAILLGKALPTKLFSQSAKAFQTSIAPIRNAISSRLSILRTDIVRQGSVSVSKTLVPKLFRNSKALNFLNKVPGFPLLASGLSVGMGIWEVFEGKKKLKRGMHHHVKLASRQTLASIDEIIDAYVKTMYAGNVYDIPENKDLKNKEEELYVAYVHVTDGNWDYLSGMYLQFESKGIRCKTETQYGLKKGWFEFDTRDLLGDCYRHKIINKSLSVSVTSIQNSLIEDTVTIDMIEVATDGRFLPTFKTANHTIPCNKTINPARNISDGLTASGGNQSSQVKLYPIRNRLTGIKVHTSTEAHSATDSDIQCKIEYTVPNDGNNVLNSVNEQTVIALDNPELDDRQRDSSDMYREDVIGKLGLEEILDSRPLGALSGQTQEGESLKISFRNTGIGIFNDDWNVDLIKLYFIGTKGQEVIFVCHTGSKWIYSNGTWEKFECKMYKPENPLTSLEQVKLRVCDKTHAGSSSYQVRLHLCENGRDFGPYGNFTVAEDREKCCRTNYFSGSYSRGETTTIDGNTNKDDGGEQLGQCEGFELTKGSISALVENREGDAVCFDNMEFYGNGDESLVSSIYPTPFRTCSLPSFWAENQKVGIDEQGDCTWRAYSDSRSLAKCSLDSTISLSFLNVGLCNLDHSASSDPFTITICESNQTNCCTTNELNTETQLQHRDTSFNSYENYKKEIWDALKLGTCYNHTMKNNVEISINLPGSDKLCVNYFQLGEQSDNRVIPETVSTCEYSNIWADSSKTMICKRDIDYNKVPIKCPGIAGTTITRITMQVSGEVNAGTSNNVTFTIRNSNGNKCKTDPFASPQAAHLEEYSRIGKDCQKLQITDYVHVWVATMEQNDDLYLTHLYLDVADEKGVTRQMACLLDQQEEFFIVVNGDESRFGLPLKCM